MRAWYLRVIMVSLFLMIALQLVSIATYVDGHRWSSVVNGGFVLLILFALVVLTSRMRRRPDGTATATLSFLTPFLKGFVAIARWNFAAFIAVTVLAATVALVAAIAFVIAVQMHSGLAAGWGIFLIVAVPVATTSALLARHLTRERRAAAALGCTDRDAWLPRATSDPRLGRVLTDRRAIVQRLAGRGVQRVECLFDVARDEVWVWLGTRSDAERDALLTGPEPEIDAVREVLTSTGYPPDELARVHTTAQSQETVDREYAASWMFAMRGTRSPQS